MWKILESEYLIRRPWLTARRDKVQLLLTIAQNTGSMNNLIHCFLAVGVEKISEQSLDATEDLEVHLMSQDEVRTLLDRNEICQALMVAPLYKYFFEMA